LATLVNGAALAIEHERLFEEEQHAAIARESDRLKSALLSSVSHDLRTPLAGIKAAASSLLQTDIVWSEDDRRAFIVDVDTEVDRLSRLVSNLLDLSRIEAGALKPAREWEDVGELVTRVARRMEAHIAGHPIQVEIPANLPNILVDPVHLEQAVANLIENAAKYSPAGTDVSIRAGMGRYPAPELTIAVSDRGPGIPAEEQQRIFDKFYRITGSGGHIGGTGMGLAIVKGLIEANGGTIGVSASPDDGTTFTIVFPTAESDRDRVRNERAEVTLSP
jgi:two-component system sensor histidine kinase KdpD